MTDVAECMNTYESGRGLACTVRGDRAAGRENMQIGVTVALDRATVRAT